MVLQREEELGMPGLALHTAPAPERVRLWHWSRRSAGSCWVLLLSARNTRLWVCALHIVL